MIYNGQESVWLYGRTVWSRGRSRLDCPAYYIGQQFSWLECGIWDAVVASSSLVYPTFDQCRRELLQCLWYSFKLSLNVLSNLRGYRTNRLGGNSFKVEIRVRFPLPIHNMLGQRNWLTRLPFTQEIMGSSPIPSTLYKTIHLDDENLKLFILVAG